MILVSTPLQHNLPELQRGDDHEDEAAEAEAGPIAVRQARVGLALQQLQQHGPPAAATATRAGSALRGAARGGPPQRAAMRRAGRAGPAAAAATTRAPSGSAAAPPGGGSRAPLAAR